VIPTKQHKKPPKISTGIIISKLTNSENLLKVHLNRQKHKTICIRMLAN